jgi:hypothetical protein
MRIDRTIYDAIDSGALTHEQVVESALRAWAEVEGPLLEQIVAEAIELRGFNATDAVRRELETYARGRAADTVRQHVRQMLEAGAMWMQ